LNLARILANEGVPIIGTSVDSIDKAEDRRLFAEVVEELKLKQPPSGTATELQQAILVSRRIGFPALVRPSFVLGGRGMEIVGDEEALAGYVERALVMTGGKPILIDRFLENAVEVDVDCISDGKRCVIGAVMQHIEEAGIHSGDSACVIPPFNLPSDIIEQIRHQTTLLAMHLGVKGLMNVQFAISGLKVNRSSAENSESTRSTIYVLEANPRASRTIPFVSKAIGKPLAQFAALVMAGFTLDEIGFTQEIVPTHYSVKESVFPFNKFHGVDTILGPEMKSTGEVMGIDDEFPMAFAKSQMAASSALPKSGNLFLSVSDQDKPEIIDCARAFASMGYRIICTRGTAKALREAGVPVEEIPKIQEGRPHLIDLIKDNKIAFIINTPSGRGRRPEESKIRSTAVTHRVTCITTVQAALAAVEACRALREREMNVVPLQDRFKKN
jgi:carbamoyl-phosphate synthase large subunit